MRSVQGYFPINSPSLQQAAGSSRTSWARGLYRNAGLNSRGLTLYLSEKLSLSLITRSLVRTEARAAHSIQEESKPGICTAVFSSYLMNSYPSICFLDCCSAMSWCFHQIPCYNPGSFSWGAAVSSELVSMCMMLGVLPARLITCVCLHWISSVILSLSILRSRCGLVLA